MKKTRLIVLFLLSTLTAAGTEMWFRPSDGFSWHTAANWMTGAATRVDRVPGATDDVALSSGRISTETPLCVTNSAACRRLTIGARFNNGACPAVSLGGKLLCAGSDDHAIVRICDEGSGALVMKGGTLDFAFKSAKHRNFEIRRTGDAVGVLRGWGVVNTSPEVTNVRMENSGKVIADGNGSPRDLDLHGVVSTVDTPGNGSREESGWYAVNAGRLLYPRTWVDGTGPIGAYCLGDVPTRSVPRGVNSLRVSFTGLTGAAFLRGALYSKDHPACPGLPDSGTCLGLWGLGLYKNNTGWRPSDGAVFAKARPVFHYDSSKRAPTDRLSLYRYENDRWVSLPITAVGQLVSVSEALDPQPNRSFNIGLFALMASPDVGTPVLPALSEKNRNTMPVIDKNIPAGNIKELSAEGDTVILDNELRDTTHDWFYWAFRACGAQGRTLRFVFRHRAPVCTRGPCISLDKGATWAYAADSFQPDAFTYTFPKDAREVWFSMGIPYTQRDWDAFLARHEADRAFIETGVLCVSKRGRAVEKARFGCITKAPQVQIWLSARHHAQEMMASYVLEGILDAVLAKNELGTWLRENVEFLVVPFVDKDGVEDGDQGKYRAPHDHNRDYDAFVHPECRGITNWITSHCGTAATGKLKIILDIHCPWIRGVHNEWLYQVYTKNTTNAAAQKRFGILLQAHQRGGMDYRQADDLPFGKAWNTGENYKQGRSFKFWALDCVPSACLVTTYEVPFATANRAVVTRETCHELGEDTAKVFRLFLSDK